MANTNAPFGFMATRRYDGAVPNFAFETVQIDTANSATKIHQGTPVTRLASGYIDIAGVEDASILGIFEGVEYYDTVQRRKVWRNAWLVPGTALAGTVKAKVTSDPMAVYEVRSNGSAITQADVGAQAEFAVGVGNDTNGISGASLDQSSIADADGQFKIVGLSQVGNNDNASSYNIVEVMLVKSQATSTTPV